MAAKVVWYNQGQSVQTKDFKEPLVFKSFKDLHKHLNPASKVHKTKKAKANAEMVSVTMWIDGATKRHKSNEVVLFKHKGSRKFNRSVFKETIADKYIKELRNNVIHVQGRNAIANACYPLFR